MWKRIIPAVIAITFLFPAVLPPAPVAHAQILDKLQEQINQTKDQLQNLFNRSQQVERQLKDQERKQKTVTNEINQMESQIQASETEVARLQGELDDARRQLEETTAELAQAEKELARRQDLLGRRIRAIYEYGTVSYLDVLFAANTFADFLTRFNNLQKIVEGDVIIFQKATNYRENVLEVKAQLEEEKARVEDLVGEVETKMANLEDSKARKDAYKQSLEQDIAKLRRAYDELERESAQISSQLKELEKQFEEQLRRTGTLMLRRPLDGTPRVSSPFGYRWHPVLQQNRLHTGVDYAVPSGTPIKAAESGLVTHAGWLGGYGNAVIIMHGKGISTLYAHQSKLAVSQGQRVEKGQVIGYVGSTGLSTGPHLHWEVRVNGEPRNPADYLNVPIN